MPRTGSWWESGQEPAAAWFSHKHPPPKMRSCTITSLCCLPMQKRTPSIGLLGRVQLVDHMLLCYLAHDSRTLDQELQTNWPTAKHYTNLPTSQRRLCQQLQPQWCATTLAPRDCRLTTHTHVLLAINPSQAQRMQVIPTCQRVLPTTPKKGTSFTQR